jgi:hypothetical protein
MSWINWKNKVFLGFADVGKFMGIALPFLGWNFGASLKLWWSIKL